ncbi:MAG: hypothetical protein SWH54_02985 [Thermodesulfobacteriota bacterium]|nr:hypothetical protein [Thermodesulfobacteriota bacterium]
MLNLVSQALTRIRRLTVTECENAFNCALRREDVNPYKYWGTCPDLNIETIEVRIGQTGGIIVVTFEAGVQTTLAEEVHSLGEPEEFDIVSPPPHPAPAPEWQRKWSVGYTLFGAKIYFGLAEVDDRELLTHMSRHFDRHQCVIQ